MRQFNASGKNLCSEYSGLAMEKALKMGESNACMKKNRSSAYRRFLWSDSSSSFKL